MKHFGKLALLGAALAASAIYSHAATLQGTFFSGVAPGTVVELPGTPTASAASLNLTFIGGSMVGYCTPPLCGSNTGTLAALDVGGLTPPTDYSFSTEAITSAGATGVEVWSDNGVSFWATAFGPINYGMDATQSVELFGYFQGGSYSVPSYGTDTVVDNGISGVPGTNIEENLTATPVPEPNSLMLLGSGLLGAAGMMMRRRRMTA